MGGIPQRPRSAQPAGRPLHLRSRLPGQHRPRGKSRGLLPSRPLPDPGNPDGDDATGKTITVDLPIQVIDTPLPYDNPYQYAGVDRFWYRLQKVTAPRVQKNHFVWHLNKASLAHLKELFLGRDWDKTQDMNPPWGVGNPFLVYRAIPAEARSLFLLENSEVIVGGITYGPVCLGQTATYAVKDHFWVTFLDPRYDPSVQNPQLGLETWSTMMDRSPIGNADYADAYAQALSKLTPAGLTVDAIWNGDGKNPNAWLTVLRHETNVSVMKGRQGGIPPPNG